MNRPSKFELAIHEAGHAVMARAVGAFVKYIEFAPDDNSPWQARFCADSYGTLPPTDWAAVFYAGFEAQRRVNPTCCLHGLDRENFHMYAASQTAREMVIAQVEATITACWRDVEQLAAEIVRCDGLYTKELEPLGYWWPAPKPEPLLLLRILKGGR